MTLPQINAVVKAIAGATGDGYDGPASTSKLTGTIDGYVTVLKTRQPGPDGGVLQEPVVIVETAAIAAAAIAIGDVVTWRRQAAAADESGTVDRIESPDLGDPDLADVRTSRIVLAAE